MLKRRFKWVTDNEVVVLGKLFEVDSSILVEVDGVEDVHSLWLSEFDWQPAQSFDELLGVDTTRVVRINRSVELLNAHAIALFV